MTKPDSGLFEGTSGLGDFYGNAEAVVASRVQGLDLSEHPLTRRQLSPRKRKIIAEKIQNRTATKEEFKHYAWNRRLDRRRKEGVDEYWRNERKLLENGGKGTREWTPEQRADILVEIIPKFNGKTMKSHHTYSVLKYPHLANLGEVIYPATDYEHLQRWHGGNYKKSLPGRRIRRIREF